MGSSSANNSPVAMDCRPFTGIKVYYNLPKDGEKYSFNVRSLACMDCSKWSMDEIFNRIYDRYNFGDVEQLDKTKILMDKNGFKIHSRSDSESCSGFNDFFTWNNVCMLRDPMMEELPKGSTFMIRVNDNGKDFVHAYFCESNKNYKASDIIRTILKCIEYHSENYTSVMAGTGRRLFDTEKLIHECSELNRFLHSIEICANYLKEYQKKLKKIDKASQTMFYPKKSIEKMKRTLVEPQIDQMESMLMNIRVAVLYLARLKPFLQNPNCADVIQALFPVLVTITGIVGMERVKEIRQPYLTHLALNTITGNLQSKQYNFYKSLGKNWNEPRIGLLMAGELCFNEAELKVIPKMFTLPISKGTFGELKYSNGERLLGNMNSPRVLIEPIEGYRPGSECLIEETGSPENYWEAIDQTHSDQEYNDQGSNDDNDQLHRDNQGDGSEDYHPKAGYLLAESNRDPESQNIRLPVLHHVPQTANQIRIRIKVVNCDDFQNDEEMEKYLDEDRRKDQPIMDSRGGYSVIVKQMPTNFAHAQFCELTSEMKCVMDENVITSETHMESHAKEYDDRKSVRSESIIDV